MIRLNGALVRCFLLATSIGAALPGMAQLGQGGVAAAEEENVIPGWPLARPDGRWLGLEVKGTSLVLRFYDESKKPVAPDAIRATARWDPIKKTGTVRTVLLPSGETLVSPPDVKPPLLFKVYLAVVGADGAAVESYVVDLRQPPVAPPAAK